MVNQLQLAMLWALCLSLAPLRAGAAAEITLVQEAVVSGERVMLSDLLTVGVPDAIRLRASEVDLGYAPRISSTRVFFRAELESRVRKLAIATRWVVPEFVVVRRWSRELSRKEIAAAIAAGLAKNQVCSADCAQVAEQSLVPGAPPRVAVEDAGLRLVRMDFEPRALRMRFRLWASADPGARPFDVYLKVDGAGASVAVARARRAPEMPLVVPGRPVQLIYEGGGIRATLPVVALQRGALGARIRVRNPANRVVMLAEVSGPQQVSIRDQAR